MNLRGQTSKIFWPLISSIAAVRCVMAGEVRTFQQTPFLNCRDLCVFEGAVDQLL